MFKKTLSLSMAACLAMAALPALAAGGGGGGGSGESRELATASSADPVFRAGVAAVKAKNWPKVLTQMNTVIQGDPKNADAWNYLGYAYRQIGDMDNSFKHYETALQLNPKHRGAHEYMGEAYLQVGNLAKAEEHLKALDKLCLFPCEEYSDLKEHIATYKREHPGSQATSQAMRRVCGGGALGPQSAVPSRVPDRLSR
jgi:tetratricopeptide (TPR) repeat protein